ncbi:MAG: lipoyl(octanoyl) transferase LipB [Chloroflexaceae bacterium]|jgi:lipoyl(octanoyl) transferase|nr:lipoyl(octanoyl) transferase LipB [Chloroflexaceae bacterium]
MLQTTTRPIFRLRRLGMLPYAQAWELQRQLVAARSAGQVEDTLLLLEHPPTITLGNKADRANILVPPEELARRGVALVETDRGGDVTYHAPGQLVGYPILKLSRHGGDVGCYVRNVEEVIIRVLASYGLTGERLPGLTGVWVEDCRLPIADCRLTGENRTENQEPRTDSSLSNAFNRQASIVNPKSKIQNPKLEKVAAIGVKLSASGVTSHGFALNVCPDMGGFAQIVPCGIRDRGVTSLEQLLGTAPPMDEVAARVVATFEEVFGVVLRDEALL